MAMIALPRIYLPLAAALLLLPAGSVGAADVGATDSAPIYTEIIPTTSGLPVDPAHDVLRHFKAPDGREVEVLVKGPVGRGTYSRAMRPDETPDAYFPAVVAEVVSAHVHHLVIPKAVYRFRGPAAGGDCTAAQYWNCAPHWTIGTYPQGQTSVPNSVVDLDIDLSGSELDFTAPAIGIWILEAERLRLRNFTIDWPTLPIASLGTIVPDPANPEHNALVIDDQYGIDDPFTGTKALIQAVDIWDDARGDRAPGTFDAKSINNFETYFIFGSAPQPKYLGRTAAGGKTYSCITCNFRNSVDDPSCNFFQGCANFDGFARDTRVIARHYTYNGFAVLVNWSRDVDLEDVWLRTGPGMGISVGNDGGFRGFRLAHSAIERGPGRLISTASDAISLGLQADVIIENNEVGHQGDDGVNLHPTLGGIATVDAAGLAVPGTCSPDTMDNPIVGDALAFFDPNLVYLATRRVTALSGTDCGTLHLALDSPVPGLTAADSFLDLNQQASARYVIRDNLFHENRGHGVLASAPYGLIDQNLFWANTMGTIALPGGAGNTPGATNLVLTGNIMVSPGLGAQDFGAISMTAFDPDGNVLDTPVFQKIVLTDNVASRSPGPALIMTSTRSFSIAGLTITDANELRNTPISYGAVSTNDSLVIDQSSSGSLCGIVRYGAASGPFGIDPSVHGVRQRSNCAAEGQP